VRLIGPLDDFPIHQDAKLLRQPATDHPDFDDATYFFITDREGELSVFSSLEVFPNRNLLRSVVFARAGTRQVRSIWVEKLDASTGSEIRVGENRFEIVRPHETWNLHFEDEEIDLLADLVWRPRCPGYLFKHVFLPGDQGPIIDMQHYTTSSTYEGTVRIGDATFGNLIGHKNRSWGVRRWTELPFYTWLNAQFDDSCVNLWLHEDQDGNPLYVDGAITTTDGRVTPVESFEHDILELHPPHNKRAKRRQLRFETVDGVRHVIDVEEIGSIALAPLPDDWNETDEEAMAHAQELAMWYEQHSRFHWGNRDGIGFVENLVAPGSRRRGIPPTEMADVDPGAFDEND
jgi:hypothetical protein